MRARGSSTAFTRPSKGERRLLARAGGEQSIHGEEGGPEDLVCTRSSGGGRGGGDFSGLGDDALISGFRIDSKGLKKERLHDTNLIAHRKGSDFQKPISSDSNRLAAIRKRK